MIELPPLPEPDVFYPDGRDQWGYEVTGCAISEEAVRAYGDACARAALEAAAALCDDLWTHSRDADECANEIRVRLNAPSSPSSSQTRS